MTQILGSRIAAELPRGTARTRWGRFVRSPRGIAALAGVALLVAVGTLGPLLFGEAATAITVDDRLQGPSLSHPFGTDALGRDVLARSLAASGIALGSALGAIGIAVVVGLILGLVPTVAGRRLRRTIVATTETLLAFPWLLTALFFAVIWGGGGIGPMLAVGLAAAPSFARLTYTLASSISGRDYVRAARVIGISPSRIVVRHILPNIAEPLIVNAAASAGGMLLAFSVLSFLGLGLQPPDYDWGRLFNEGMSRFYVAPLGALVPGIAIVLASLTMNLIGEAAAVSVGVRSPRARTRRTGVGSSESATTDARSPVLSVRDLRIAFGPDRRRVERVHGISFDVHAGEIVGIVGESGSGKSLTALVCAGLSDPSAVVTAERLDFDGERIPRQGERLTAAQRRRLGTRLSVVFQDPMSSLNPSLRVGLQLAEVVEVHEGATRRVAWRRAVDRLDAVRIAEPARRAEQYPQALSGGMRQRVMIAMGLMGSPRLIIADEPTTALDVRVQRSVIGLLDRARRDEGAAVLLISHDIALVSSICDRVLVMYRGEIVEELDGTRLQEARHPYARALIDCVPDMATPRDAALPTIAADPSAPAATTGGAE